VPVGASTTATSAADSDGACLDAIASSAAASPTSMPARSDSS
jgi:hypothetical protein